MFKLFVLLVMAVWAVEADNLYDVTLPQQRASHLFSEADNSEYSGSHSDRKDATCCIGDKLNIDYSQQMHEIKKQCAIKWRANNSVESFDPFDCKSMTGIRELIICEEECFARATKQIEGSGQFNREAIKQHYAQHTVGDIEWKKAAVAGYIDNCVDQNMTANKQQQQSDQKCNTAALDLHYCIWFKFRSGCPTELRSNSTRCNRMRKQLDQDSEQFFHRQLLLKFINSSFL